MDNIVYLFNPWWEHKEFFTGIPRKKYLELVVSNLENKQALIVVGSRRVGKTTLIHQTIKHLLQKGIEAKHLVYLPLDHPSLQGKKILELLEQVRTLHGFARSEKLYLFLDEVQFFDNWEQEAKAITDFENIKLIISGSASTKILSRGSFLTGRTITLTIRPFDFKEFVAYRSKNIRATDTALLESLFKDYLQTGGYPEYVKEQNPLYFSDLTTNVVNKDIANLFPVKNPTFVSQLLSLLADRTGSQTSFSKLGKIMDLNKDTVSDYIRYLTLTFLISDLEKFSTSRNSRIYSPKKFYLLDTGLLFNLTGKLNLGAAAENAVFQKLSSDGIKFGYYFENQREIDFLTASGKAYEVKYELDNQGWEKLEKTISNLPKGKFKEIIILTQNPRNDLEINNISVKFQKISNFL